MLLHIIPACQHFNVPLNVHVYCQFRDRRALNLCHIHAQDVCSESEGCLINLCQSVQVNVLLTPSRRSVLYLCHGNEDVICLEPKGHWFISLNTNLTPFWLSVDDVQYFPQNWGKAGWGMFYPINRSTLCGTFQWHNEINKRCTPLSVTLLCEDYCISMVEVSWSSG